MKKREKSVKQKKREIRKILLVKKKGKNVSNKNCE